MPSFWDLVSALGQMPSWAEQANQVTQQNIANYQAGGVPALMANTQPTQGLLGGFGGATSSKMAKQFLRIGEWHPSETSRNYALGKIEKGVSVYELDSNGKPIQPADTQWPEDLIDRLKGTEPKYIVTGDHVGTGHDGEPLLKNLKIIGNFE